MFWIAREMREAFADLLYFTLTGKVRPLRHGHYDTGHYEKLLKDIPKDEVRTKEVYLEVNGVLVKIFLGASLKHSRMGNTQASFKCRILEIDGQELPVEKQLEGEKKLESFDCAPTREDEKELLLDALRHFSIEGIPRIVDNEFVEDHLQLVEVRKRLHAT